MSDDYDPIYDIAYGRNKASIPTSKTPTSNLFVSTPPVSLKSNTLESLTSQASSLSTSSSNLTGSITNPTTYVTGLSSNNLTNSLTSGLSGMTGNLTGGLTSGLSNITGSITSGLSGITSSITNVTSGITNTVSTVSNVLSSLTGGVTSRLFPSLPAYTGKLAYNVTDPYFKDPNKPDNTVTGNFTTDVQKKMSEFTSSAQAAASSLQNSAGSTMNAPVSFISSLTKKLIEGANLPGSTEDLSQFASMGFGQLGKLGSLLGEGASSLSDGLGAVLGGISSGIASGTQAVTGIIKDVYDGVSEVISPIVDVVDTVYTLTDPRIAGGLVNEFLGFLPDDIQYKLAQEATSWMNDITGGIHNTTGNILGIVDNVDYLFDGDLERILTGMYYTFGSSSDFTIGDSSGSWLNGQSTWTGNAQQYEVLSSMVNVLCGEDYVSPLWNSTSGLKDAFDLALLQGMEKGAGKLVEGLLTCPQASSNFTERSLNVARSGMSQVATNGDIYTYQTLINNVGTDVVLNPKSDALTLNAMSPYSESNYTAINDVMNKLGLTHEDLITKTNIGEINVIDGRAALLAQVSDPEYAELFASAEDFAAINAAMKLYA